MLAQNYLRKICILIAFTYSLIPVSKAAGFPIDSVGVQVLNNQRYVVHKVKAKETFYVLARLYKVSATKLIKANPQVKTGLQEGTLVYIPRADKGKPVAVAIKEPVYILDANGTKIHKVTGKQTLFSISQQYKVTPADLKKWNNLASDQVQAGQTLMVSLPVKSSVAEKGAITQTATPPVIILPGVVKPNTTEDTAAATHVLTRLKESGIAEVINGPNVNKYLALHHSAPVGSYITVTNSMNGRSLSVRVIGTLPDIGANDKVIVKLSKKAQQRLAAIDNRFLVDVVYAAVEE